MSGQMGHRVCQGKWDTECQANGTYSMLGQMGHRLYQGKWDIEYVRQMGHRECQANGI